MTADSFSIWPARRATSAAARAPSCYTRRVKLIPEENKAAGLMVEKESRALVVKRVHEEARDIRAFDVLPEGARDCHDIEFTPGQVALLEVGDAGRAHFAIAS